LQISSHPAFAKVMRENDNDDDKGNGKDKHQCKLKYRQLLRTAVSEFPTNFNKFAFLSKVTSAHGGGFGGL